MTEHSPDSRSRIKQFLNDQATTRLAQLGHSEPMIRDAKREAWWWLQTRAEALKRRTGLVSGRAIVWTAPGLAELVRVEVPRACGEEVTVELLSTAVSTGTERARYLRLPNIAVSFPERPGYSGAGVVVAKGEDVSRFQVGDLVAVRNTPHVSVATVPASLVYPVPAGVSHAAACLVQLGVICGQGVRRAAVEPNEPVVVLGAGLIGALAQRLATAAGAGPVSVIARSHAKETIVRNGGARFLVAEEDGAEITTLGASVVIEATGDPGALALAVEAASEGARIVLLGSPRGTTADLPVGPIRAKRLRLIGAHVSTLDRQSELRGERAYEREAKRFLALLAKGDLEVLDLINEVVDPREADAFYRRLATSSEILGARFDWTRIPREERIAAGHLWHLPDLSGRGTDPRRPLPPESRRRRSRASRLELADPFAGATGSLRIGLLGCGDIAFANAAALAAAPNVELVACYDPVLALAEELAKTYGGEAAPSSDVLLARKDVDAVLLSVPHHLHEPLGAQAAAAGKHVIVEKPLANDLAAGLELVREAERAGVILSVCFPQRYQPDVIVARRLIKAGALGGVEGVQLSFFMDKPSSYWVGGFSGRAQSDWRSSRQRAGGGVLISNLSHHIDLIRHLTGMEPEVVTAQEHCSGAQEVEDAISVSVRYGNGALGSLFATAALRGTPWLTELRLWGRDGHMTIGSKPLVYTLRAIDGLVTGRWQSFGRLPEVNDRAVYFSRLATAIARGDLPDVSPDDGLAAQAFIEAAYRSSESGSGVSPAALLEEARV